MDTPPLTPRKGSSDSCDPFTFAFDFLLESASRTLKESQEELESLERLLASLPIESDFEIRMEDPCGMDEETWVNPWQPMECDLIMEEMPVDEIADVKRVRMDETANVKRASMDADTKTDLESAESLPQPSLRSTRNTNARRSSQSKKPLENPFQDLAQAPFLNSKKSRIQLSDIKQWVGAAARKDVSGWTTTDFLSQLGSTEMFFADVFDTIPKEKEMTLLDKGRKSPRRHSTTALSHEEIERRKQVKRWLGLDQRRPSLSEESAPSS